MKNFQDSDLQKLTRLELYEIAKDLQVPGRSGLTKVQLINAIVEIQQLKEVIEQAKPVRKTSYSHRKAEAAPDQGTPDKTSRARKEPAASKKATLRASPKDSTSEPFGLSTDANSVEDCPLPVTSAIQPQSAPGAWLAEPAKVPRGYGDTRIVLQARDPHWAHCYWEISPSVKNRLQKELGDSVYFQSRLCLRVHDVTDVAFNGTNAHSFSDIPIVDEADNWYLHLEIPDRSFLVDLGLVTPDGRFLLIVRSNNIRTPRDHPSDLVDPNWEVDESHFDQLLRLSGGMLTGQSSGGLVQARQPELELSSGVLSSWSSPGGGYCSTAEKVFRLEVHTELIVYGSTDPSACVTVQGHPVKLRPDGTFTLRFALPDGSQEIPVRALNHDGDLERTITPIVTKRTV